MPKTKTIINEEKAKSVKESKRKTNSTQSQRLSFLEDEFKKVILSLQKELKELKEDTIVNAQYLAMLKKQSNDKINALNHEVKANEEMIFNVKEVLCNHLEDNESFVKGLELESEARDKEKELIHKVLECLITHIETLENKNKGFFSFSKSQLRAELEDLKIQKAKERLSFSLNDD